jgi:hypothetical protein
MIECCVLNSEAGTALSAPPAAPRENPFYQELMKSGIFPRDALPDFHI